MKNCGRIVALDREADKIAQLKKDAARMGVSIIETMQADLIRPLYPSLAEKFDYVLVDAPCSGAGTLRRNPEIKWRLTAADLKFFSDTQKTILGNASRAVKKGGRLIYCACSALPVENDEVIRHFLAENPQFKVEPASADGFKSLTDNRGFFRTYPHRQNMDGFFGAILRHRI